MRIAIVFAALTTAFLAAGSVRASDEEAVLFAREPWFVFRTGVDGEAVCYARTTRDGTEFLVFGTKTVSLINIQRPGWTFGEHKGSLMLKVDDAGMGTQDGAIYSGDFVRLAGATDVIYVILLGIDFPGDEIEVLGDDNKVLATFGTAGFSGALKAWKACIDAL